MLPDHPFHIYEVGRHLDIPSVGPTSMRRSRPRPSGGTTEARSSAGGGNWVQALSQALGHPDIRLSRQLAGPKEAVRGSLAPFLGWPLGVMRIPLLAGYEPTLAGTAKERFATILLPNSVARGATNPDEIGFEMKKCGRNKQKL